ncbi:MAG: UDP-N-acetylmuramoyl-tripeptide--D-alanyl-D-alanine ligase [Minwuia sp.]|nr:UDP-N-acetylmuramoyl-tripeptide--D-alanyl-D-alanine ligase [Minwuia sp.]
MSILWTAAEAAQATGGVAAGTWDATGVSIDSRTVAAGDLFIALQGPNADGHDHVTGALDKGAIAALVHRPITGIDPDRLLLVGDTMTALEALGHASRARTTATVIGVTGSCGKTGTKAALAHCLTVSGVRVHASEKSYNNHWGVPLTLARMPREAEVAVLEIGMNHPGEIRALTAMARPDVAVITTVEAAHLAAFRSLDEIADAKAEIFEGLTPNGAAVLPADNACHGRLLAAAQAAGAGRIVSFGAAETAQYRIIRAVLNAEASCVEADLAGRPAAICIGIPGQHWVSNAMAVLAVIDMAGGDVGRAAPALRSLEAVAGRGARTTVTLPGGDTFLLVDDSYNANPGSMRAAMSVLGAAEPTPGGRRIAILGDMLELGPTATELHRGLADAVVAAGVDVALLCGPEMAALAEALEGHVATIVHQPASDALVPYAIEQARRGDVVLVKGSLGSRMAPIVAALRNLEAAADNPRAACG